MQHWMQRQRHQKMRDYYRYYHMTICGIQPLFEGDAINLGWWQSSMAEKNRGIGIYGVSIPRQLADKFLGDSIDFVSIDEWHDIDDFPDLDDEEWKEVPFGYSRGAAIMRIWEGMKITETKLMSWAKETRFNGKNEFEQKFGSHRNRKGRK